MKLRLYLIALLFFVAFPYRSLAQEPSPVPVVFSAMGCGPYNADAETALERFIKLENEEMKSSFLIHCGDIVTGKKVDWPESQYVRVADLLSANNKIPTFIVPGDNEWNDQVDPDRHWGYWEKHFLNFDEKWTLGSEWKVERQTVRSENFAFIKQDVLFIGINKVGGKVHDATEWKTRLKQDTEWISDLLTRYGSQCHSTVIFAQASPGVKFPSFRKEMMAPIKKYGKPVLYLHADGHKWIYEPDLSVTNFTRLQIDLLNAKFPPVQVTVTGNPAEPFTFDRRLDKQKWIPTP